MVRTDLVGPPFRQCKVLLAGLLVGSSAMIQSENALTTPALQGPKMAAVICFAHEYLRHQPSPRKRTSPAHIFV